ncbi:hypothetical protein SUGI_0255480 [Cryptomeria japonica]|nr:hypothetical protein SUGI_0255480 [Cryptomeria japonica]
MRITLKINDISNFSIDVNIWGDGWQTIGDELEKRHCFGDLVVVFVINGRVGYFNGKVINNTAATVLNVNPSILETRVLMARGELTSNVVLLPSTPGQLNTPYTRMILASILERSSVMTKAMETIVRATVMFIKPDAFCYLACLLKLNGKQCKKKCVQENANEWFFPRCKLQIPECTYRYLLQVKIHDHTDNM